MHSSFQILAANLNNSKITYLFLTAIRLEVVLEYELVQAGEHKFHLLMNVLDMETLEAQITSDAVKEW